MRPTVQDRGAPTVNGTYSDCTVVNMNLNLTAKSLNPFDERCADQRGGRSSSHHRTIFWDDRLAIAGNAGSGGDYEILPQCVSSRGE